MILVFVYMRGFIPFCSDEYITWYRFDIFFSFYTFTHVQFKQLHKYIQKRNKIYKKWYSQKQPLDIKLFGKSRKQTNIYIYIYIYIYIKLKKEKNKKGMLAQKVLSHLLL